MTSKEMAAIAWKNMESFDWALQKNSTETKFEQFIIYDAAEILNMNQVSAYIKELKQYFPLRHLMENEVDEEALKLRIESNIRSRKMAEWERKHFN
jgi:hypothetical protein